MDKKDFKNLLSEALGRQDRKFEKLLKKGFENNNKKLIREFNDFVAVSIVPQFDRIYTELKGLRKRVDSTEHWVNDLSHSQDQILRTLVKHEDRFDHLGSRQDKILKILEKRVR